MSSSGQSVPEGPHTSLLPGLGLAGLLAVLAIGLGRWPLLQKLLPLSPLLLAIGLGAVVGNSLKLPPTFKPGLVFALKKVLRLGIILLGFRISLSQVQAVGWQGLLLLCVCVGACFGFTLWCGRRLGIDLKLTLLLASGISICGASAIVATDAVIEAEEHDCAYAVALITLFGTLGMLAYPLLQLLLQLSPAGYGLWTGASLHEVAQVVAAGFAHGEASGQMASLVKLTRVVFLVPVTLGLLLWQLNRRQGPDRLDWGKLPIPWFVFGFLGVIGLNSLNWLPATLTAAFTELDLWLLTMSMAALGTETRLDKLKASGLKPLWLGLASSLFISLLSLGLIVLWRP
ncbi:MAG TPA: YeiH family protein [Candidatus Obscuribacterales bacterium]